MATLGNPKNTIEVIQKYGFQFQKKFGQNFLIDPHILEEIIYEAGVTKDDFVLEIGPGIGTMTQYLCESAREVVAVEALPLTLARPTVNRGIAGSPSFATETKVPATTAVKEAITRIRTSSAKMVNRRCARTPMFSLMTSPMEPPL